MGGDPLMLLFYRFNFRLTLMVLQLQLFYLLFDSKYWLDHGRCHFAETVRVVIQEVLPDGNTVHPNLHCEDDRVSEEGTYDTCTLYNEHLICDGMYISMVNPDRAVELAIWKRLWLFIELAYVLIFLHQGHRREILQLMLVEWILCIIFLLVCHCRSAFFFLFF